MNKKHKHIDTESKLYLQNVSINTDWDKYLEYLDSFLKGKGFIKYAQNYKREDFTYWKQYDEKYQIGLLIYDWRKYPQYKLEKKVSISFECMLLGIDERCDLCVSKDIELHEFEMIADSFYNSISNIYKKCRKTYSSL